MNYTKYNCAILFAILTTVTLLGSSELDDPRFLFLIVPAFFCLLGFTWAIKKEQYM